MSQFASHLQNFFKPREVLIAGIVLLLILGSLGLFWLIKLPDVVASEVQSTAPAQMKAISTAYANRSSARSAATAMVQARGSATVQAIATATAQVTDATATAIASGNPYPPHNGTLAIDDSLRNNSANYWDDGTFKADFCRFTGGAYHAKVAEDNTNYICMEGETQFDNFVFQVQMTFVSDNGGGGIAFHIDAQSGHRYSFDIRPDGTYSFYKFINNQPALPLLENSNSAIKTGKGKTNLVTVIARGKTFDFYVNHQHIDSINDGDLSHGYIGTNVSSLTGPSEVAFNDAKVWKL